MPYWYYEKKELRHTPSVNQGITLEEETIFRREGARFILQLGNKMGLRYETVATGVVYFHRFYMVHTFQEFPRHVTACCCLFLAGKVEETPKKCKDIMRHARALVDDATWAEFGADPREEVMTLERILLQTIKFDFIVEHPYTYLLKYAKCLKGDKKKLQSIVQMAWTFVNDGLCTTLCLQWEPEIIAIALMYLAGKLNKFEVVDWQGKTSKQQKWWDMFVQGISMDLLEDICHQVLDLYSPNKTEPSSGSSHAISGTASGVNSTSNSGGGSGGGGGGAGGSGSSNSSSSSIGVATGGSSSGGGNTAPSTNTSQEAPTTTTASSSAGQKGVEAPKPIPTTCSAPPPAKKPKKEEVRPASPVKSEPVTVTQATAAAAASSSYPYPYHYSGYPPPTYPPPPPPASSSGTGTPQRYSYPFPPGSTQHPPPQNTTPAHANPPPPASFQPPPQSRYPPPAAAPHTTTTATSIPPPHFAQAPPPPSPYPSPHNPHSLSYPPPPSAGPPPHYPPPSSQPRSITHYQHGNGPPYYTPNPQTGSYQQPPPSSGSYPPPSGTYSHTPPSRQYNYPPST